MKTCFQKACRFKEYTTEQRFIDGKDVKIGYRDDFVRGTNVLHMKIGKPQEMTIIKHSQVCQYGEPLKAVGKTLYWDGRP